MVASGILSIYLVKSQISFITGHSFESIQYDLNKVVPVFEILMAEPHET